MPKNILTGDESDAIALRVFKDRAKLRAALESTTAQRDALCAALVMVLDAFPLDGEGLSDTQLDALGYAYGLLENIAANGGSDIRVPNNDVH